MNKTKKYLFIIAIPKTIKSMALLFLLLPALLLGAIPKADAAGGATTDPEKVLGVDSCSKDCHKGEAEIWKETKHSKSFTELPDSEEARKITGKLGKKRFKRDERCIMCHFTEKVVQGKYQGVSGPSCEDCHGEGKEWVDIHGDYGGKNVQKHQETAAHKLSRIRRSEAAGLIRPANLLATARNCYDCHLGHDEVLVNLGGHTAGSDIDLVSWSQGKVGKLPSIRHNVFYSKENNISPPHRLRMFYVLGNMLELEYSLRALSKATTKAPFAKSMARRSFKVFRKLAFIYKTVAIPELQTLLQGMGKIKNKLKLNNNQELLKLANFANQEAAKLVKNHDGSKWVALDPIMPFQP